MQSVVDSQTNKVGGALNVSGISIQQAQWKWKLAVFDKPNEGLVECFIQQLRDPAVEHRGHGMEHDVVLCPSDLRVRLQLVNGAIGQDVALREHAGHAQGGGDFADAARRKFSEYVA